jgi:D-alanyl-D-alanine carboxypeptidase (penicillin-binding protein 5/6)
VTYAIWALALLALLPGDILVNTAPRLAVHQDPPVISTVPPQPVAVKTGVDPLKLRAKASYAIERRSGQVLHSNNAARPLPVASITKLATVVTILHDHKLGEMVTIPVLPTYQPEDELIGLKAGEHYTVRDLLAATLIGSANDAADALAINDSGTITAFSDKMNQRMVDWHIANAHFSNPTGLTDAGNAASAQAIAQLGLLVLHNQTVREFINDKNGTITSKEGRTIPLTTTNQLLQTGKFNGIKTGYTLAAGQCFVGLSTIQNREVVTVVLGSPDRFGETQTLTNWINQTYTWQ